MKFKYILFLAFCISLSITNVHASSIEYNLTIDDNMNFIENNIYKAKLEVLEKMQHEIYMNNGRIIKKILDERKKGTI